MNTVRDRQKDEYYPWGVKTPAIPVTAVETTVIILVAYTIEKKAIKVGEAGQQIRPESAQMQVFTCTCSYFGIFVLLYFLTLHSHSLCYVYSGL